MNDKTLDTMIYLLVVFAVFLLIVCILAFILAKSLSHRVLEPIGLMEKCLTGEISLRTINKDYNAETNTIFRHLRHLESLEALIYPKFLVNPKIDIRAKNLKHARKFFKETDNKRGYAITCNLIGNIQFTRRHFKSALKLYSKAKISMEELLIKIEKQETEENNLSPKERTKLKLDIGKSYAGWGPEKEFLQADINNRVMQVCMAKLAYLVEESAPIIELRGD